jgi:hypothetical protein
MAEDKTTSDAEVKVVDTVDEILDHANQPTTPPEEQVGIVDRLKSVFKKKEGE